MVWRAHARLLAVARARRSAIRLRAFSTSLSYEHEQESMSRARTRSHPHDLIAAIDVDDLAGDRRGAVAGEENSGGAELGRIATAFQRRVLLIML